MSGGTDIRPLERVLERLDGVQQNGAGYQALCPSHDDKNPSLSVNEGDDGRVLVKCFAGCPAEEVVGAMGMSMADLFEPVHRNGANGHRGNGRPKLTETYGYAEEDGGLLFEVVRFEPKDFRQRRPDGNGGWAWNLRGVEPVLYRLSEVLRAVEAGKAVFLVEGEKDADRLAALGFAATTSPMGAGKWRSSYAETLAGGKVVIVPDNDPPGQEHAERVAASLARAGAKVKVLGLPGLADKSDVSDWLDAGGSAKELVRLAGETPAWKPKEVSSLSPSFSSNDRDDTNRVPSLEVKRFRDLPKSAGRARSWWRASSRSGSRPRSTVTAARRRACSPSR